MNLRTWQLAITWSLTVALVLFTVRGIANDLSGEAYNWDIDHEMYFGWQLTKGTLIWSIEYNDKLPAVQYLFAIPAFFGSVKIWQMFSLALIALAMTSLFWLIDGGLCRTRGSRLWQVTLVAFSASFFGFWSIILPGGFSTINSSASSLFVLATVSYLRWAAADSHATLQTRVLLAFATLSASLSVSTRPYLIVALLPIQIGIMFIPGVHKKQRYSPSSFTSRFVAVFGWFVIAFVGLNAFPYIFAGKIGAFLNGIRFLASDRNPMIGSVEMLSTAGGPTLLFWMLYILLCIVGASVSIRSGTRRGALLSSILGAVALPFIFTYLHWWDHYIVLLVGPITIVLVLSLLALSERSLKHLPSERGHSGLRSLPIAVIVTTGIIALPVLARYYPHQAIENAAVHKEAKSVSKFSNFLDRAGSKDVSFLFPESVYAHWKLKQDRHGFPHAANTAHILSGWWSDAPSATSFLVPRSKQQYCRLLSSRGPTLVVIRSESELISCLDGNESPYRLNTTLPDAHEPLNVYIRRSAIGG